MDHIYSCQKPAGGISDENTHVSLEPLPAHTLASLLTQRAAESPNTVYCSYRDTSLTLRDLEKRVNQFANLLWARGIRPGDRVALMLPSHPNHLIAFFALAKLGAVRVPINIHLLGAPLQHAFTHLDPKVLIAHVAYRDVLADISASLDLCLWEGDPEADPFEDSLRESTQVPHAISPDADDIIGLTPSSGTTGAPKGVLKSDRHLRAGPHTVLRLTGAQPGDVFLFWESLHHGSGVAVAIAALMGGFRLAMIERFSASRFWEDARRLQATHIHYLGSVLPMLLNQPPSRRDKDHSVRIAWGGGCSPETWNAFAERFGVSMRQGYGLSELLTFVTLNLDGPAGSIGKPIGYYDLKLVDDIGTPVASGQTGEVLIRSRVPGLQFLGYFRCPENTAEALDGQWLRTGDLAYADADGYLFYAGRKKEMLRRRGINISAWEVEQVFLQHADIEEAALVGVPSELGEDELKLFVRPRDGAVPDPLALIQWSETRLPYFQIPRYIEFINEFPKTPTQRIQKKALPRDTLNVWDLHVTNYNIRSKKQSPH
ncbi:AMP-binding protein [Pollutimonas sp. H1-120]|uniref:AMP-binding protein n=1 Tax=Pollutimonas sp. H1-120 TaxID=3148824 RepID=UPI003B5242A6